MAIVSTPLEFNPRHPKYQCCCGLLSSKTGSLVFGILEALGMALSVVFMAFVMSAVGHELDRNPHAAFYGMDSAFVGRLLLPIMLLLIPMIVVTVLFFKGICKDKASWLVPHLFIQVCGLVILYVYMVFVLWGLIELKVFSDRMDAAETALAEVETETSALTGINNAINFDNFKHSNNDQTYGHNYHSISTVNGYQVTFRPTHLWAHMIRGCWGGVFFWLFSALFQYWRLRVVYSYYTFCNDKTLWESQQNNCERVVSQDSPPEYCEPLNEEKKDNMFDISIA